MKPETEKPSKEDTPIEGVTPPVKSAEEPTQITVADPPQNRAPQNELTQEEIAKAKEIIRWLKENGCRVTSPIAISYKAETRIAGNFAYTRHGPNNLVTLQNLGPDKVELTIINVGSATFTFHADGELQPAK